MNFQKTPTELVSMREGGHRLGTILKELLDMAQVGVTLLSIDARAFELIKNAGGSASFLTVDGYTWATCLCVNEVVVHGIPTEYALKDGDVLTIDVGMVYNGLHTDTAWTKIIRGPEPSLHGYEQKERLLKAGEEAMWQGIRIARAGNRVGHISQAIQKVIEGAGYSVVRTLVGHGVGRELHEEPQVPGILKGPIEKTPLLVPGMTIAVEVIYAEGGGAVVYHNADGWSIATKDYSLSSVFEHTIEVRDGDPQVLTRWS